MSNANNNQTQEPVQTVQNVSKKPEEKKKGLFSCCGGDK